MVHAHVGGQDAADGRCQGDALDPTPAARQGVGDAAKGLLESQHGADATGGRATPANRPGGATAALSSGLVLSPGGPR